LEELLDSSSAIAALGAAKELLNRTPKVEAPVPFEDAPQRGIPLADVLEAAIACSVVSPEELLARAEAARVEFPGFAA